MKINEIIVERDEIDEGFLDNIKGAYQKYNDKRQTAQASRDFDKYVETVTRGWLTYSAGNGIKQTNAQYKELLDRYIQISAGFKNKNQIPNPSTATTNTPQGIRQYVKDGLTAYNSQTGAANVQPTSAGQTPAAAPAAPAPTNTNSTDTAYIPKPGYRLHMEVPFKQPNGTTITRYFILGPNGLWAEISTDGAQHDPDLVNDNEQHILHQLAKNNKYPKTYKKVANPQPSPAETTKRNRRKSRR